MTADRIDIISAQLRKLQNVADQTTTPAKAPAASDSFGKVLQDKVSQAGGVKFSAHALGRLQSRGIQLSQENLVRIGSAVERAEAKGARESLLVMDDLALIVSIANRTVITVMDGASMRENVFTNIDSAVFV